MTSPDDERRIVEDPFDDWPPRDKPREVRRDAPTPEPTEERELQPSVVVPPDALSADTLAALIEEFVTRHGTELSDAASKVAQVRRHLAAGKVQIVFDPNTESCNITEV